MSNYINIKCCNYKDTKPMLDNTEECIICFNELDNTHSIDLNKLKFKDRRCQCKGILHKSCFYEWYDKNHTCPICSGAIVLNESFVLIIYKNKNKLSTIGFLILILGFYIYYIFY